MKTRRGFEQRLQHATGPLGTAALVLHVVLALPFLGFGLFVAGEGISRWSQGRGDGLPMTLFGLVFGAMGIGIVALAARRRRNLRGLSDRLEAQPDEPWHLNEDWASGRIQGAGRAQVVFAWAFGSIWTLLSAPAVIVLPRELARGNHGALAVLLFPLVGLLILGFAVVATARYRRHGRSVLEMDLMPGVLGGDFRATLLSQHPLPRDATLRVTLRNIRRTTSGSGKNRSTSERVLWEDHVDLAGSSMSRRPDGHGLGIHMRVPCDAEPSDPIPSRSCILWRLLAHADLAGADFSTQFDVPVFETPASDASLTSKALSRQRGATDAPVGAGAGEAEPSSIEIEPRGDGGFEIHLPAARNKGAATTVTLLAASFGAATWFLTSHAPLLWSIVFGAVALGLLVGSLNMWLRSTRVVVGPDGVSLTTRLLGVGRTRFVPREAVTRVSLESGLQSGSTSYWDVRLHHSGPRHGAITRLAGLRIGPSIRDRREAERLVERVEDALGLE